MNKGTLYLNFILEFERRMESLGYLPFVELLTIGPKIWAATLERSLRVNQNTGQD